MRFRNFYSIGIIIGFITLMFSSCSSVKEGSYAYMDDIYVNQYPDEIIVLAEEVESDEYGEPPSNVPGAAYVYQPIPEPKITYSSPYTYSPYTSIYDDEYYNDEYYNPNGVANSLFSDNYPFGISLFNGYNLFFNTYLGYNYYSGSNPYSGGCIVSSNNTGSSSSFITKRFSWNDSANEIIQYLGDRSQSNQNASSTTNRNSNSRKSRFTNSNTSSDSKTGDGFIKFLSNAMENSGNSRSSGTTKSSNSSSGSSRSGSSSGSSGTYSGKRIR